MKALLIAPAVLAIILGMAIELEDIARSSSQKALDFADDMNSAMECASTGRPIRECSPGLYETNFHKEIEKTIKVMDKYKNMNITQEQIIKSDNQSAL